MKGDQLMKKSILIGKQGNDKVILEVKLEKKAITQSSAITTLLTPVYDDNFLTLSITGQIGNHSFGQIYDSIMPSMMDELYVDSDWLIRLIAIWKSCHLNDMNAGSELQMEYIDFYRNQFLKTEGHIDYNQICAMLDQHHLLIDNETNPNLNVGYRYGTSWLIRLLPDSIKEFFDNIQSTSQDMIRSNILDYLLEHNYKWTITPTDDNPHMTNQSIDMDHWKAIFKNSDGNQFTTYFSTGLGHRLYPTDKQPSLNLIAMRWAKKTIRMLGKPDMIGKWRSSIRELGLYIDYAPLASASNRSIYEGIRKSPMPDDIVQSICGDYLSIEGYNSWDDWACDMGFDINSKEDRLNAKTAYNTVIKQSDKAQMFFRSDWSALCNESY
jgi:hypothetical protein